MYARIGCVSGPPTLMVPGLPGVWNSGRTQDCTLSTTQDEQRRANDPGSVVNAADPSLIAAAVDLEVL